MMFPFLGGGNQPNENLEEQTMEAIIGVIRIAVEKGKLNPSKAVQCIQDAYVVCCCDMFHNPTEALEAAVELLQDPKVNEIVKRAQKRNRQENGNYEHN